MCLTGLVRANMLEIIILKFEQKIAVILQFVFYT